MKVKLSSFFVCAILLLSIACKQKHGDAARSGGNPKLIGEWHSKKDGSKLSISNKSDSPDPEDYFVQGDTIYTSFQGNLPYTKYTIKKLDEHNLAIFTPDSVVEEYVK
jgi:hypothetical protein